jgi:beta-phosphoglucomutase-like phosphatase (HAD superfamily)
VATSSPLRHALELLDQLGLGNSCQTVAGGDEVVNGKPAPDIYLLAAKRLGLRPAQCLAVEDSAPGCQAALSAGFMVVAVPNRDTKASDFSTVDYTFSSLLEVVERFEDLLVELAKR